MNPQVLTRNRLLADFLSLSNYQNRIAVLILRGLRNKEIASLLGITPAALYIQRSYIYDAFGGKQHFKEFCYVSKEAKGGEGMEELFQQMQLRGYLSSSHNEVFKSRFYGLICLTPGQWYTPEETTSKAWWAVKLWIVRN